MTQQEQLEIFVKEYSAEQKERQRAVENAYKSLTKPWKKENITLLALMLSFFIGFSFSVSPVGPLLKTILWIPFFICFNLNNFISRKARKAEDHFHREIGAHKGVMRLGVRLGYWQFGIGPSPKLDAEFQHLCMKPEDRPS
jgi:uncharacterized protein YeaO (DUF488 family)